MPFDHESCAVCGERECECRYEDDQAGRFSEVVETTSAQSTVGEMRAAVEHLLSDRDDDTPATWKISLTPLVEDPEEDDDQDEPSPAQKRLKVVSSQPRATVRGQKPPGRKLGHRS